MIGNIILGALILSLAWYFGKCISNLFDRIDKLEHELISRIEKSK